MKIQIQIYINVDCLKLVRSVVENGNQVPFRTVGPAQCFKSYLLETARIKRKGNGSHFCIATSST